MRIYTETPLRLTPPRGVVIASDWDRPPPRPPAPDYEAMRARLAAAIVAENRRMLGLWVSECEPAVILAPDGCLLGLGLAGTVRVIVPSRLATPEACMAAIGPGDPRRDVIAQAMRKDAGICWRQRRRRWSRLCTRAAEAIWAGRRDPGLADELQAFADACQSKGRHGFAGKLRAAAGAVSAPAQTA